MKRRSVLQTLIAGSSSLALTPFLHAGCVSRSESEHVLILLDLKGGNDGLNTLAPIEDERYRRSRPTLALNADAPVLDRGLAMHPLLSPLLPLWDHNRLGFALGVGWSKPSRSHFKASDQWATGRQDGEGLGWLAQAWLDHDVTAPLLSLASAGSAAMEGGSALALQLNPAVLRSASALGLHPGAERDSPVLRRMLELEWTAHRAVSQLRDRLAPLPSEVQLPKGSLGPQVAMALRLLGSGVCPPVLHMDLGGFDTHANQARRHGAALRQVAQGLVALDSGLRQLPYAPEVSLLAVSEFGRRLKENGSRGTDHGNASVAIRYGNFIKDPFLGEYPDLERLDERGDLIPTMEPTFLYKKSLKDVLSAKIVSRRI